MNLRSFSNFYKKSDERSKLAYKNIIITTCVRIANIICSLLLIPLTINYINPTQYGIWLTLATIIGWVHFFDLGLGNGFRNKFAEAKALGNDELALEYVSTTYFVIGTIMLVVYSALLIANAFVDWAVVLKVDESYRIDLQYVFAIVCGFTCLNMVVNIFGTLLTADQKPACASIIQGVGQYLSLFAIYILTKTTSGSLMNLALYYSGVPCIVMLLASLILFNRGEYKKYKPNLANIRFSLLRNIIGLGIQFFVIYLCMIVIFQLVNIVLSREAGPLSVTEYNVANRYFNIIYMAATIVVTPFWSAFTDAFTKRDYVWMKNITKKIEVMWVLSCGFGVVMLIASSFAYRVWIGDSVHVSYRMSASMLFFILAMTIGSIYMNLLNGIGAIRLQLITYVVISLVAWPVLVYSCRIFGAEGIVILPTVAYGVQAVICRIQLKMILNDNAKGIWVK